MADDFRYHIDHHGSLVRPAELLAARASGDPQALAAAAEQAVIAAAHLQRRLVLSAVGDGQFRREYFESVVYDHVDGFAPATGAQPLADAAGIPPAALDTLLDETPFHRLCADFPADPAARLPLERIKPGLVISLGVVDVASPELEEVDELLDRVDPVVEQRGDLDVAIATNAGFAASADRPLLGEDAQQAKLRLVETVARYYWGNEI